MDYGACVNYATQGGESMDIDGWKQEVLNGVEEMKSEVQEWIKQAKKNAKSWRESQRYKVRNFKARMQKEIAELKQQPNKGEKVDDGSKNTDRKSTDDKDLLGDTDGVDNEAEADNGS